METSEQKEEKQLPFNNLFLNAGFVNGLNEWWMYVFGICACILGYFIFQLFILFPLINAAVSNGVTFTEIQLKPEILFDPSKTGINKNLLLSFLFGMFVFAFIGLVFAIKKLHKKTLTSVITAYEKVRWGRVFFAFGIWAALILINTLVGYFMNSEDVQVQFNPVNFFILLLIAVILLPIQTSTEEILFRGYMVQGLSLIFKNGLTKTES